jgi:hypothetical protein
MSSSSASWRKSSARRLDIHLVLDNYGTHKHPKVKEWFAAHPRYRLHFTPTNCSWRNLIERWFAEITRKRIRRGTFRSVPDARYVALGARPSSLSSRGGAWLQEVSPGDDARAA